jgi:TRAP-type C4-dicarboxylate transport system substrate-binding protein
VITLRFGGYQPARSVHTRGLHALAGIVGRRSAGELGIEVTENVVPAGHKAADLFDLVSSGALDGCYFASSYLAGRVPALGVLDLPFQSGSRAAAFAALDGAGGALLARAVADATPYRVLGYWDNGIRHISNAVRPIHAPADCVGLRLRTLDSALQQAAFRRVGFRPEFIDVAELPRAVAQRRVDAQENPLTNMINFGLQAYHKHVSLTGHLLGIALVLVNRARFDALPAELRGVVIDAVHESETVQRGFAAEEDAACLKLLGEAGITPVGPEAIDLPTFRTAVADVVVAAAGEFAPDLRLVFLGTAAE